METLIWSCNTCSSPVIFEVDDKLMDKSWINRYRDTAKCATCQATELKAKKEWELENVIIPKRIKASRLPLNFYPDGYEKSRLPEPELHDFVYANRQKSIILSDTYNAGKTGTLIHFGLIQCKFDDVLFYLVPDLMDELASCEHNFNRQSHFFDLMKKVKNVSLLILDDIGKEQKKDKYRQWLYQIVDARYTHNRRTWSTCNMGDEQYLRQYGEDTSDPLKKRLAGKYGEVWDNVVLNNQILKQ